MHHSELNFIFSFITTFSSGGVLQERFLIVFHLVYVWKWTNELKFPESIGFCVSDDGSLDHSFLVGGTAESCGDNAVALFLVGMMSLNCVLWQGNC